MGDMNLASMIHVFPASTVLHPTSFARDVCHQSTRKSLSLSLSLYFSFCVCASVSVCLSLSLTHTTVGDRYHKAAFIPQRNTTQDTVIRRVVVRCVTQDHVHRRVPNTFRKMSDDDSACYLID